MLHWIVFFCNEFSGRSRKGINYLISGNLHRPKNNHINSPIPLPEKSFLFKTKNLGLTPSSTPESAMPLVECIMYIQCYLVDGRESHSTIYVAKYPGPPQSSNGAKQIIKLPKLQSMFPFLSIKHFLSLNFICYPCDFCRRVETSWSYLGIKNN